MGFVFAFMTAFLYAVSNILIKRGMKFSKNNNGTFNTAFVNVAILGLVLIIYRMVEHHPDPINVTGFLLFILAGLSTTLIGRSMHFLGIRKIGSAKASVIKNSAPIFTLLFALLILKETIGGWPWLGLGLILLGLMTHDTEIFKKSTESINRWGALITLLGAIGFGIGQGVRKQALFHFNDPFAGAFIGASVALLGFFFIEAKNKSLISSVKEIILLQNKYYLVAGIATSFALLFFFISLWFIQVAYVAAIVAIEPVLCVVLSKLFLASEEVITPKVLISASFIFSGAGIIAVMG
ncbi:DMT family transporter [Oceanobacillus alkalisoli]|uniref:DMT family transporter n=1 Tax=Oceanobacillus alkalisoli TaxID=2925113 RepID=UPI001F11BE70|nr:DMT family transporter [Oceanobacillus alkalisoli]MCF3944093.1 DMT family transporter [Oceanobacillus alkalisoli]